MLCRQPYVRDPSGRVFKTLDPENFHKGIPFPCGHCLPCRINRRRKWSLRLLLESMAYAPEDVQFITLTYSDEFLPFADSDKPVLNVSDVQKWIKRVRYYYPSIRYFIGGEYGTKTSRPHYHCLLFGCSPLLGKHAVELWRESKARPLGLTHIGEQNTFDSIQYVAGYVSKKVGFPHLTPRRFREFCIQSRKPPIGFVMYNQLVSELAKFKESTHAKLPTSLKIGRRCLPFDRTFINHLCRSFSDEFDISDFEWSQCKKFFEASSSIDGFTSEFGVLADSLMGESEQRYKQIKARHSIFSQGKL